MVIKIDFGEFVVWIWDLKYLYKVGGLVFWYIYKSYFFVNCGNLYLWVEIRKWLDIVDLFMMW